MLDDFHFEIAFQIYFGYVFDSCVNKLKDAFNIVDLFVIDALKDGQVCIEMKIINAAEIIRRI